MPVELTYFQAVVLGVVEGLTEFLPVSSTAHLRIVPALLGWEDPGAAYSAVIQLGTTAAVILYFAKDLLALGRAWVQGLLARAPLGTTDARLAWGVLIGTYSSIFVAAPLLIHLPGRVPGQRWAGEGGTDAKEAPARA